MIMIFRARIMNEIYWLRFALLFFFLFCSRPFVSNSLPFFWWSCTFWAIKRHRDRFENPQIISDWITICFVSVTAYAAIHQTTAQRDTNGCNVLCEVEIKPICAINDKGETKWFPSKCIMESENCVNKSSKAIQRSTKIREPILISISLQSSRQYPTVRVLHFSCLHNKLCDTNTDAHSMVTSPHTSDCGDPEQSITICWPAKHPNHITKCLGSLLILIFIARHPLKS